MLVPHTAPKTEPRVGGDPGLRLSLSPQRRRQWEQLTLCRLPGLSAIGRQKAIQGFILGGQFNPNPPDKSMVKIKEAWADSGS